MQEEVTYFVFGQMDEESQGGWIELWSGSYSDCVDYVNSPQARLDVDMGVYTNHVIWDEEYADAIMEMVGADGQTLH
jgi:hypothetical protein